MSCLPRPSEALTATLHPKQLREGAAVGPEQFFVGPEAIYKANRVNAAPAASPVHSTADRAALALGEEIRPAQYQSALAPTTAWITKPATRAAPPTCRTDTESPPWSSMPTI